MVLAKAVSKRVRDESPLTHFVLEQFQLFEDEINQLMGKHIDGGGDSEDVYDIACEYVKANREKLKKIVPRCSPIEDFDATFRECVPVSFVGVVSRCCSRDDQLWHDSH